MDRARVGVSYCEVKRPQELKELVGNGYLALIHADGNGIGSRAGKIDVPRAAFFHRNRVLLRRALQQVIDKHCPDAGLAPLILLMLGGDNILLVTRAEIALPFVVTLCTALDALRENETGSRPARMALPNAMPYVCFRGRSGCASLLKVQRLRMSRRSSSSLIARLHWARWGTCPSAVTRHVGPVGDAGRSGLLGQR